MQNNALGTLDFYLDDADPGSKSVYELVEGENFVGGNLFCDVKLACGNIDNLHCKITLTPKGEYRLEDISNPNHGIYRVTQKNSRQRLKPNKEYELLPEKPFYLNNEYKCIFKPKGQSGSSILYSKFDQSCLGVTKHARSSSSLPAHDQEEEETYIPPILTGATSVKAAFEETLPKREFEKSSPMLKQRRSSKKDTSVVMEVEEPKPSLETLKEEKIVSEPKQKEQQHEAREEVRTSFTTERSDSVVKEKSSVQNNGISEENQEQPKEKEEEPKLRKKDSVPKKLPKDKKIEVLPSPKQIENEAPILNKENSTPVKEFGTPQNSQKERIEELETPRQNSQTESRKQHALQENKHSEVPVAESPKIQKQVSTPTLKKRESEKSKLKEESESGEPRTGNMSKQDTILFEDDGDNMEEEFDSDIKIPKKSDSHREKEMVVEAAEETKVQRFNEEPPKEKRFPEEETKSRRYEGGERQDYSRSERKERNRGMEEEKHYRGHDDDEVEEGYIGTDSGRYEPNLSREMSSKKNSIERRRRDQEERSSGYKQGYRDRKKDFDRDRRRDYDREKDMYPEKGREWGYDKERERDFDRERGMFERRRDDRREREKERDDRRPFSSRERQTEGKEEGELNFHRRKRDERDFGPEAYPGRDEKFRNQDKDFRYDKNDKERENKDFKPRDDRMERKPSNYDEQNKLNRVNSRGSHDSYKNTSINNNALPEKLNIVKREKDQRDFRGNQGGQVNQFHQNREKPPHRPWQEDKTEEENRMQNFPQYLAQYHQPQHQPPPPAREPKKTETLLPPPPRESGKESKGKEEDDLESDFDGFPIRKKSVNEPRNNNPLEKKSKIAHKTETKALQKFTMKGFGGEEDLHPPPDLTVERKKSEGLKREATDSLHKYEKMSTSSKKQKMSEDNIAHDGVNSGKASTTHPKVSPIREEAVDHSHEKEARPKQHPVYNIMFSGFDREDREVDEAKKKLAHLGLKIVEEKERTFNVLVIKKFKRTVKFLLALNKGVDIVSLDWIRQCIKEDRVLPPQNFIFSDKVSESKFKFKLSTSLQKARRKHQGFLKGYKVFFPLDILPSLEEMKLLVESADGVWMRNRPMQYRDDVLVVLNEEDKKNAASFKDIGFTPHSCELVFSGILRQELNLEENRI